MFLSGLLKKKVQKLKNSTGYQWFQMMMKRLRNDIEIKNDFKNDLKVNLKNSI